jgi:hypothetical protein
MHSASYPLWRLSNLLYLTIIIPLYKTVPPPGSIPVDPKTFQDLFTNHWLRLFNTIVFNLILLFHAPNIIECIQSNESATYSGAYEGPNSRTANGGNFPQNLCIHTNEDFPIGICPFV